MILTVMSKSFKKFRSRIINSVNYKCCKQFSNETFRETLTNNLSSKEFGHNDKELELFCKICIKTVNNFNLIKRKYTQGNQMPFMTK